MSDPVARNIWQQSVIVAAPILLLLFSLLHGVEFVISHGVGMPDADQWVHYLSTVPRRWLALHFAGLVVFPMLAVAVWWILPAKGTASRISRVALALYIVLYPAFDALVGIGSSILIRQREVLTPSDRAVLDPIIKNLFFSFSGPKFWLAAAASLAWGIGVVAAAVALWRPWGWRVGFPLAVAGVAMAADHMPPFGAVAGLMFGIAVWQLRRCERAVLASSWDQLTASPSRH
jgi:hypothetical protein